MNIDIISSGILSPLKRWSSRWSLWPCHFVTSCCGVELAHASGCGYDMERLGTLAMGISRQTNTIIVEGTITRKMARALKIVWEQMPDPKFVNVIGACGQHGGIFWNSYNITHPHRIVPVDFFVPGCPVTPEGLIRGVRALQDKIWGENRNTIEFKFTKFPSKGKRCIPPGSPKLIAPTPLIRNDLPQRDWEEGKRLVETLRDRIDGSIVITDMGRITIKTQSDRIRDTAKKLLDLGFDHVKSVNIIDIPHERRMILEYLISSYRDDLKGIILMLTVDLRGEEPPSISDIFPSADYTERELQDLFGVSFGDNPWNDRFISAPDTPHAPLRKSFTIPEEIYILGDSPLAPEIDVPSNLDMPLPEGLVGDVKKSEEYLVIVGPHHTGSGHMRWIMRLDGDIIREVIPDPGYVHRAMEKLAENRLYIQNIPLFERLCIVDPIHMNLGYVLAIERALGIEVPERARYIRTMMAELSRIGCFFYDAGIFSLFMGHSTGFMYLWAIREMMLELFLRITGSRHTPTFILPGGVRRDIGDREIDLVIEFTSAIESRLRKFIDIFVRNPVLLARVKGVGILTSEDAKKYGIVGPFLRASGIEYDVRKVEPYDAYQDLDWEVVGGDDGDSLVRFLVRLEEVEQSLHIIRTCAKKLRGLGGEVISPEILGDYPELAIAKDIRGGLYRVYGNLVLPKGEWTSLTEASRGTLLYTIVSDGESNIPYRVRVITPSWMNLRGLIEACKGERMADFWAIYGSFGYFPPEADR
ncbi:MAG: NADH-quinone oxidoreductase subunit D [Candidatus Syntropharchaeia archaeon]